MILKWRLDEDGGGQYWTRKLSTVVQGTDTFDDLSELPERFAVAIRKDGRREGEVELPD